MVLPTQKKGNRQKRRATSLRRRRRAGMPVRLGLTPTNAKHREPSRVGRHATEFPLHKKSRETQLLNRMETSMSSRERRELDNRMKALSLKKDLGLSNLDFMEFFYNSIGIFNSNTLPIPR